MIEFSPGYSLGSLAERKYKQNNLAKNVITVGDGQLINKTEHSSITWSEQLLTSSRLLLTQASHMTMLETNLNYTLRTA